MVTQHGDAPDHTPKSDDWDPITPHRRRLPPPRLVLDSTTMTPHTTAPTTPTKAHSARLPPPNQFYTPLHGLLRNTDLFIPPASATLQRQGGIAYTGVPVRSTTFPTGPINDNPQWPLENDITIQSAYSSPVAKPSRPGLRISMSTSTLRSRRRSPHSGEQQSIEIGPNGRALPRFPPQVASDFYDNDPLRSSLTSGQTSFSSMEQTSGTERSSVLTKSSSLTDLSPDTPDGGYGGEEDMSVEDAIGMYLDDMIDVPEESPIVQAVPAVCDIASVPEISLQTEQLTPLNGPIPLRNEEEKRWSENFGEDASTQMEEKTLEPVDSPVIQEHRAEHHETGYQEIQKESEDGATVHSKPTPPSSWQSEIVELSGVVPPLFLPGSDERDRYGFRKATHHVSLSQFESWNGPYADFAEHRRLRWVELLEASGLPSQSPVTFPPKSSKIKRYVRKGIPSEYRGAAWFWYVGGFDHMHRNPGHYAELVRQAMESPSNDDKEHIERDLHRTFPDNIHFKPEMPVDSGTGNSGTGSSNPKYRSVVVETQMIRSLRHVLYAFALHNPRIGYTQSLNFITGLLLLFLSEEKTFWMLHIITSNYLPNTHEISLEGANVDLWILMVLLKETMPSIYTKIASSGPTSSRAKPPALTVQTRLPDITLGLTNWLMSLFIGSLPLETTLRVWDCFFYEGSKTFFRVALAIFKASERDILAVSDPMEVFQIVQTVPKKLLDANALIDESLARRYRVGQGRIDELREERRTAIRQEKTRLSLVSGKLLAGAERPATRTGARSPLPKLEREIVGSWRHMKHYALK